MNWECNKHGDIGYGTGSIKLDKSSAFMYLKLYKVMYTIKIWKDPKMIR